MPEITRLALRSRAAPSPIPLAFADGNLTILADGQAVTVHAMVMARESSVFNLIWDRRPQPSSSGVVLMLNDTGVSIIYLTNAVYNVDRPFLDQSPMDIPRFLSLLHMSLKYHYHSLFESLLSRVQDRFPSDITDIDDARLSTTLLLEPGDEFELIPVAGNFGFSSSLPAIYYRVRCTMGREALITAQLEYTWVWLVTEDGANYCDTPFSCSTVRDVMRGAVFPRSTGRRYGQIRTLTPLTLALRSDLCEPCKHHAALVHGGGRNTVWSNLPSTFGLSSWDDLVVSDSMVGVFVLHSGLFAQ
ncbi:hypothetical protein DXG01_010259 [Tephrocybe rancida]|nr:hypothetical protein DXG01_010259 [Tephrocybe rancida]